MSIPMPSPEEQKRLIDAGITLALKALPGLQITGKDQEIGLRAYVAGFVAGCGWSAARENSRHEQN